MKNSNVQHFFFFSSRRRHTRSTRDWSSDVCSSDLDEEQLAAIYQAADVHLLTSWGEGFGLPTLQAASAGVVPIAVDYTASRELVGRHGFAVSAESSVLDEFGLVRAF